jgi:hypothetical protein
MEELLSKPTEQKITVNAFRDALSPLPAALSKGETEDDTKPLIVIIDEPDRCKPLFALSILEQVNDRAGLITYTANDIVDRLK